MSKACDRKITAFDSEAIKVNGLLAMHRSRLRKKAWIVVEGDDDKKLFDKLIPLKEIYISDSAVEPGGTGNCDNVVFIVKQLQTRAYEMPVVGIRDRDHLTFLRNHCYKTWKNIFLTDKRDMENMILSSDVVLRKMENKHPGFIQKLNDVKRVTRPMGVLRVYNSIHYLGVDMKTVFSPNNTMQPQKLLWKQTDWKNMLVSLFNNGLPRKRHSKRKSLSLKQFGIFDKSLSSYADDMICQGHDVVRYLYHSKPFATNVSQKTFYSTLFSFYSESGDFSGTKLYLKLKDWLWNRTGVRI